MFTVKLVGIKYSLYREEIAKELKCEKGKEGERREERQRLPLHSLHFTQIGLRNSNACESVCVCTYMCLLMCVNTLLYIYT